MLINKLILLAVTVSVGAFADDKQFPTYLSTVPTYRTTLHPRTFIRTQYAKHSTLNSPIAVSANMIFNTSVPCIHLDNFRQIVTVRCHAESIVIGFSSTINAVDAYSAWSSEVGLTVLLG
jgi:hypothetical protein